MKLAFKSFLRPEVIKERPVGVLLQSEKRHLCLHFIEALPSRVFLKMGEYC